MKSLHWRIFSTITLFVVSVGINYSTIVAEKVYTNITKLIGSDRSLFPEAVKFLADFWIDSDWWMLMWIPVGLALVFTWMPKIDWIGALFTSVSTAMIMAALFFVPMTGWVTSYHVALIIAKERPKPVETQ